MLHVVEGFCGGIPDSFAGGHANSWRCLGRGKFLLATAFLRWRNREYLVVEQLRYLFDCSFGVYNQYAGPGFVRFIATELGGEHCLNRFCTWILLGLFSNQD